jgi:hypothetical protein
MGRGAGEEHFLAIWPSDAEGILQIPLPNHNQPDFIATFCH